MTANYIVKGLTQVGHVFDRAPDGRDGLFLAAGEKYDVQIVYRMLPGSCSI
jgi:two-component system, OmpR family, response regulator